MADLEPGGALHVVAGRVHLHGGVPRARRDEGDAQESPAGAQEDEDECWLWGTGATGGGAGGDRHHPAQDPLQGPSQGPHLK